MARLSLAVTLVLLLPLVGCRDEQPTQITDAPPAAASEGEDTDDLKDRIEDLIGELYAESEKKEDAEELWEDLKETLDDEVSEEDLATARDLMFDLLDLTYSTELSDPKGDLTTNEGVAELTSALFEFVGASSDDFSNDLSNEELANALGEDGDDGTLQVAFDGETNEIVTDSGFAGTIIEDEDIDQDVLIAIDRLTLAEQEDLPEGDCLPDSELEQAEGCYQFDRSPEDTFRDTVEVGVCPDPDLDDEGFQLHEFEDAGDGGVEGIVALPSIAFTAAGFDCTDFTIVRSAESPFPWRLAEAAWSATGGKLLTWIGPAPLRAIDSGDGGSTLDFSRIGWAKQMDVDIVEGDGQTAQAGTQVSTDPKVRVTHLPENDDDNPIPGVDVTFTVVKGGGSVDSSTVTTDSLGEASISWTLGTPGTNELEASVPRSRVVFTANATAVLFGVDAGSDAYYALDTASVDTTMIRTLDPDPTDNVPRFSTPVAMALNSSGEVFIWNNTDPDRALVQLDRCSGQPTIIDSLIDAQEEGALAFGPEPAEPLYKFAQIDTLDLSKLYVLDLATGAKVDSISFSPTLDVNVAGLSATSGGDLMAAAQPTADQIPVLYRIDPSDGSWVQIGELSQDIGVLGTLAIDGDGALWGTGFGGPDGDIVFRIDAQANVSRIQSLEEAPQGMVFPDQRCP